MEAHVPTKVGKSKQTPPRASAANGVYLRMLSQFQEHIARHQLCNSKDWILLAVSGGIDSMTLLHLLISAGYTVGVGHCNFGLRGQDSLDDEHFVAHVCDALQIPFYATMLDAQGYAHTHKVSIQAAARALRYRWLEETRAREHYHCIATAHHLNDDIETFLINWLRGSGLTGLKGIEARAGRVIRPLLDFNKQEIETYAQERGLAWREDKTNHTAAYRRNEIRLGVVPALKAINPSLERVFLDTRQRLRGAFELFELGKAQIMREFVRSTPKGIYIDKAIIGRLRHAAPALWELIKPYGFNYTQCQQIVAGTKRQVGKLFLSPSHRLTIDRKALILCAHPAATPEKVEIGAKDHTAILAAWRMTIDFTHHNALLHNPLCASLDADMLSFPLRWRRWKSGDSFQPLGMARHKKLSNFFIDRKVSRLDKERATVLESGGKIVWVVGYQIDHRFRITERTTRVYNLSVEDGF